jgi:nucleotide-binding universal stress UspA family protein
MKILAAVDLADTADRALTVAGDMAARTDGHVYVLHVAEPDPDFVGYDIGPDVVRDQVAEEFHREHREVQAVAEGLRQKGIDATALMIQGAIVETILREAERLDVDFIVVTSHGHGAAFDLLIGSISKGVVHKSSRPVVVVPSTEY